MRIAGYSPIAKRPGLPLHRKIYHEDQEKHQEKKYLFSDVA
jgi:hypothetical protein